MKKINVGILFGGKSAEHEVSIQSARNIFKALDKNKYQSLLIGIDKNGRWLFYDQASFLLHSEQVSLRKFSKAVKEIALVPQSQGKILNVSGLASKKSIDVVFPILHGPFGEDGTIQGLLKLANVPFVGAGVLSSAVGMDKDIMKRLWREAGLPICKFLVFKNKESINYKQVVKNLGLPFFVKPANLGSSVGISKVSNQSQFTKAVKIAWQYDNKIIIEENITGREIECAILGNEDLKASVPGEVKPSHDFYSYEAKYIDEHGATLIIPAKLSKNVIKKIQDLSVKAFKVLDTEGLGRVDLFLKNNGEIVLNEINTMPGFTVISMYARLWQASGLSYDKLIDNLIQLAISRFKKEQKLKTTYL